MIVLLKNFQVKDWLDLYLFKILHLMWGEERFEYPIMLRENRIEIIQKCCIFVNFLLPQLIVIKYVKNNAAPFSIWLTETLVYIT